MKNLRTVLFIVVFGSLVVNIHGGDDDDDDEEDDHRSFGSQLSDVMDRVKTREIERMLQTSWCVVRGPSCTTNIRGDSLSNEEHLNRFSQCICDASRVGAQCTMPITFQHSDIHHMTFQSSFSVVYYWLGSVKDFYCYISVRSVFNCSLTQILSIPSGSRTEVRNFVRDIQREITNRSSCNEFCNRFRCIYEGWTDSERTGTAIKPLYNKCVNQMCTTTPSHTTTQTTTVLPAMRSHLEVPSVESSGKTLISNAVTRKDVHFLDAAKQDGDDIESSDSSSLVGGLVGGLLALALLGIAAFIILLWRRRRQQSKEKRAVPSVSFVARCSDQSNTTESTQGNHQRRNHVTAMNPLAVTRHEKHRRSDVKPLTSYDDTYATLSECQMNGSISNPAFDKGEEHVLAHGSSNGSDFALEGVYAAPTNCNNNKVNGDSSSDDQYLEPVQQSDRYVTFPAQYLEPVNETPNENEYVEPVSEESGYVGNSYMRMESSVSDRSAVHSSVTEDIQYEVLNSAEKNYYNL